MLMRSLSRRGSKLDKNPTPPPAEEDDGRVNVRAYNKKVRRGSPGSSAPPPQGPPPFPHSRATGVDGRGDDHASPEGHAHGRRLQTLRGAKGRRRELADFRARAASRGFAPRVGSPAPPFVRSQVANGQQIAKHARLMDLKRDAASPPMDPATALAQSLSLDGPEPCYVNGGRRRSSAKQRSASISSVDIRGPTNTLDSATGEAGSTRTRRRKSFTFDKAGNVVGGGSEPRPADEETKEEQVPAAPDAPKAPKEDATCVVNVPPPKPAEDDDAAFDPAVDAHPAFEHQDSGASDYMELTIEGLDDEWI